MADDDAMFFSPSGRFACRLGHTPESVKSMKSVHFLDFEEETYREIYLVVPKICRIKHIFWLDDSNIRVLLSLSRSRNGKSVLLSKLPMMSFYQLDFRKEQLKPKKTIFWKKGEGIPTRGNNMYSDGFLTIDGKEFLVETVNVDMGYDADTDADFFDLKKLEEYNGIPNDYMWIRLIPKYLQKVSETQKIWINFKEALTEAEIEIDPEDHICWSLSAHKQNLYFGLFGKQFIIFDIAKYLGTRMKTGRPPLVSEFCTGAKILSTEPHFQYLYFRNETIFLVKRGNYNYSTVLWNLESKGVSRLYMVDEKIVPPSVENDDNAGYLPFIMMHPSGHILEIPYYVFLFVRLEQGFRLDPKIDFPLKFLPLNPIKTNVLSLKALAISQDILNRSQKTELLPRCLREGRTELNLTLIQATPPAESEKWWSTVQDCFVMLRTQYSRFSGGFNSSNEPVPVHSDN